MEKSYKFLGISAIIFKVLGWAAIVIGTVSAVVIFIGGGTPQAPKISGVVGILLGLVYFFLFYTASDVIALLLEVRNKLNKGATA